MRFSTLACLWVGACLASYPLGQGAGAPTGRVGDLVRELADARGGLSDGCASMLQDLASAQIRRYGSYEQPSRPLHARKAAERLQAYLDAHCPLGPALAMRAAAHDEAGAWRAAAGLPPLALEPFAAPGHP